MPMPRFHYHEPMSVEEACQTLDTLRNKAYLIAGGTDLLVNMKSGALKPENIVSLSRISSLSETVRSDSLLRIGACVNVAEIAQSTELKSDFSALSAAACNLGSPSIRNLATIGGNIVTARPAADLLPPLMAYQAKLKLKSSAKERTMPLEQFLVGPGETVIEPDEILSEIVLERPPSHSGCAYFRLGLRKGLCISVVNVAAFLSLDAQDGKIETARVILGSVAPTPVRAIAAEGFLCGKEGTESLFKEAGQLAVEACIPIDDLRGSSQYRRAMVGVITRRVLSSALKDARNRSEN